ncbi:HeH/LEM domain-containing protein [Streptococcus sp. ZJ151]|uniref:HeH/LEM domain-containing protein n=1 Tax=Streptococcus jiangjianxini TaxID=3161189 RepID=UPI0032ED6DFA
MTYRTTKNILDSKDNDRFYEKGETYPRVGLEVSKTRIEELLEKKAIERFDENTALDDFEQSSSHLNVKALKEKLDSLGVSYDSKAKKAELLTLLKREEGK